MDCCNQIEMPKWKCHKEVHADKITRVVVDGDNVILHLEHGIAQVSLSYYNKHNPMVGGYYVVYEGGYQSFSPAKAFEDGYSSISGCKDSCENEAVKCLDFGQALRCLKSGKKVARKGWNGKNQFVVLIPAGNAMFMQYPMQDCYGLKNAQGNMQPGWVPSVGDLNAKDWEVVE
jgi:hypothetical protein